MPAVPPASTWAQPPAKVPRATARAQPTRLLAEPPLCLHPPSSLWLSIFPSQFQAPASLCPCVCLHHPPCVRMSVSTRSSSRPHLSPAPFSLFPAFLSPLSPRLLFSRFFIQCACVSSSRLCPHPCSNVCLSPASWFCFSVSNSPSSSPSPRLSLHLRSCLCSTSPKTPSFDQWGMNQAKTSGSP